ncbi:hypothetical protein CBR_g41198 [Chara braunii]|uniref:galactinol--sucrose galactosyltransferase n=1 Tax=Chara braunii TaxID=69332 RepID=A0A388K2K3_CHABU|nr:hypothetical protein CBR_g41198 [Chara braunii]|eukprot:GBG64278.1 hypothetical protein CBR_g41198 [Chara braunii]
MGGRCGRSRARGKAFRKGREGPDGRVVREAKRGGDPDCRATQTATTSSNQINIASHLEVVTVISTVSPLEEVRFGGVRASPQCRRRFGGVHAKDPLELRRPLQRMRSCNLNATAAYVQISETGESRALFSSSTGCCGFHTLLYPGGNCGASGEAALSMTSVWASELCCRFAGRTWAAFGSGNACRSHRWAGRNGGFRAGLGCAIDRSVSFPVATPAGLRRSISYRGRRRAGTGKLLREVDQVRRRELRFVGVDRGLRFLRTQLARTTSRSRSCRRKPLFETRGLRSSCRGAPSKVESSQTRGRRLRHGETGLSFADGAYDRLPPLVRHVSAPFSPQVRARLRRPVCACFASSSTIPDSIDEDDVEEEDDSASPALLGVEDHLSGVPAGLAVRSPRPLVHSEEGLEEMAAGIFTGELPSPMAIVDGKLMVHGTSILTEVPNNVIISPDETMWGATGAFLGAEFDSSSSRHVVSLGVLRDLRFVCCFRFKLWWMAQGVGSRGKDVPVETQFLLVEGSETEESALGNRTGSSDSLSELLAGGGVFGAGQVDETAAHGKRVYTVFLPLLEKAFRACLHGNEKDELELCIESGDPAVETKSAAAAVYVSSGRNPFNVITDAVSLAEGGAPARFVIIDDGWQSTGRDHDDNAADGAVTAGTQYARRLTALKSNRKFLKEKVDDSSDEASSDSSGDAAAVPGNFGHFVKNIKNKFNLKYVYVWHALTGYWGGVCPNSVEMEHYTPSLKFPVPSPGVLVNQPDMAGDSLTLNGLGLVHPGKAFDFFNQLHAYLAASGVDGVKVDVQNILETLGAGFGGRVEITKMYHKALEESIRQNFPDNGCIACMSHNTDGLYSAKQTAVVRASDDFWPSDPAAHTVHICSVAYNSLFLGEFMQPDWDMFHSHHPAAEFHAAARAIGGCAVYVSDKPGNHDFGVLRKLVLPDGRILRARLPGRPTRDCLFVDPLRDGCSLLKIWNVNVAGGVVGAFNCQGSGWCRTGMKYVIHDPTPGHVSGHVKAADVDSLGALVADDGWNGDTAVYSHRGGELILLPRGQSVPVSLAVLEFEVFTVAPTKAVAPGVFFAPIGLVDMFNSGGAILFMKYSADSEGECSHEGQHQVHATRANDASVSSESVTMAVRGCGRFVAYSSETPKACMIDNNSTSYSYSDDDHRLSLELGKPVDGHVWTVKICY